MTYEEALESIKYELFEEGHCTYIEEELRLAIEALEKQIPKKPIKQNDIILPLNPPMYFWKCGNCNAGVGYDKQNKFCPSCGQAIDWSDNND